MDGSSKRIPTREETLRSARLRKRNAAFLAENPAPAEQEKKPEPKKSEVIDAIFICNYCDLVGLEFEPVKSHAVEKHLANPKGRSPNVCIYCSYEAANCTALKTHYHSCELKRIKEVIHTRNSNPVVKIPVHNYQVYECRVCHFKHVAKAAVRRHATTTHFLDVPVFVCIYCNVSIADRGLFVLHLSVSHRRMVVDLSFDCTALSLLNKFLDYAILSSPVTKEQFIQASTVEIPEFSLNDTRILLQKLALESTSTKRETRRDSKITRSKVKCESKPKAFVNLVLEMLEDMRAEGEEASDKESTEKGQLSPEKMASIFATYFGGEPKETSDCDAKPKDNDNIEDKQKETDASEESSKQPDTSEKSPNAIEESSKQPDSFEESPNGIEESSKQPDTSEESSKQPDNIEESSKQPDTSEESSKQPDNIEESPKPPDTSEESSKQPDTSEERLKQIDTSEESPKQPDTSEESSKPPDSSEESTKQPEKIEESSKEPDNMEESSTEFDNIKESPKQPDSVEDLKETDHVEEKTGETNAITIEDDDEEPIFKISEVYSLSEKNMDEFITVPVGTEELPQEVVEAEKPDEMETDSGKGSEKSSTVTVAVMANESPDTETRYNFRKRKASVLIEKDTESDTQSDTESSEDERPAKRSRIQKSPTKTVAGSQPQQGKYLKIRPRPRPIIIEPVDQSVNALPKMSVTPTALSNLLKGGLATQTSQTNLTPTTVSISNVTLASPLANMRQVTPQTATPLPTVTQPGQATGAFPTLLTSINPQVIQPKSYMILNGQLVPVISPILTTNVQQPIVLPQLPTMPLQVQQLRPQTVVSSQGMSLTPAQGITLLGGTLPQQGIVLNKGIGSQAVNMVPNAPIQTLTRIPLPQTAPAAPQLIQQPRMLTGAPAGPTPVSLVIPSSNQALQYRLEKNAQGVFTLQSIPAMNLAHPVSIASLSTNTNTATTTMGSPVQPGPASLNPSAPLRLLKTEQVKPQLKVIRKKGVKVSHILAEAKRLKKQIDPTLDPDDPDDSGSDVDSDNDMKVTSLNDIVPSSQVSPELFSVTVYVCRRCMTLRSKRGAMVNHIIVAHFDDGTSAAKRRKVIALGKKGYYFEHSLKVMRAVDDWDIPLFRCRHCHLFHVEESYVAKHIMSGHVSIEGLNTPSRHSLRDPRNLKKIGSEVMCTTSTSNLKVLGIFLKEQPAWSVAFLSQVNNSPVGAIGLVHKPCSFHHLVRIALLLGKDPTAELPWDNSDSEEASTSQVSSTSRKPLPCKVVEYHPREAERNKPIKIVGYGCMKCSFRGETYEAVREHVSDKHTIKPYKCQHCSYDTFDEVYVRRHIRNNHSNLSHCTDWDFIRRNTTGSNIKALISTYYDTHLPAINKQAPTLYQTKDSTPDLDITSASSSSIQVEADSSCDVELNIELSQDNDGPEESKLDGISAPNILSCSPVGGGGDGDGMLPSYGQGGMLDDDEEEEHIAGVDAVNLDESENTTGEAFACRLCAYSCDTYKRIKSHLMGSHISSDMYPFRCHTCGYIVPSTLRLAQHMQYKHLKNAKKNPPKLARELQNDKELWPQIMPDQTKHDRFQQELDCLLRNCVEKS